MKKDSSKIPFTTYQRIVIFLLALTQFSVVLDFMVMSPLGDLLMKELKISPAQFGVVVSSYAFAAGTAGFLTASFADKFDRKKLLLFFYGGFILGTFLCGMASSFEFLVFARIFTGLFGGVISSISLAIVADLFDLNHRGRAMGYLQMGFGLSQILGIPISLFLATVFNWKAPFLLIVGLALVIFFTVLFVLQPVDEHLAHQRDNPFRHLMKTLKNKEYRIAYLATAFMSLGGYLMMPWGSAYSVNNIGILQSDLPLLFMVVGLATFIVMPLVGTISDRFNKFQVFAFASIQMVIAVLIYTNLPKVNLITLIAVNIFMMTGIMARMVPSQALNASIPGIADRGAFMSINSSLQQLSGGMAALLGGVIVLQKNEFSPLERFDLLGWVVVGIILLNIYLTRRVYKLALKRA